MLNQCVSIDGKKECYKDGDEASEKKRVCELDKFSSQGSGRV